ncbi:MAG: DUF222 domain-containing protein [Pseudonocardiaceae bacterium]|nr:DUF222 domain-containing protein [Pseudonocardiaceae bacterium]
MTVAVSSSVVSDAEVVDELRAAWAQVSRSYARCWAAMAAVAERSPDDWETDEIAAALTFTTRRASYELDGAQLVVDRLPRVFAALAAGQLDHHKARVFASYLREVTAEQAEVISARLVGAATAWTTSQLATRLLREVQAVDPEYTRRTYQQAVRERGLYGYLDHTGTAVLTGTGLPAPDAAARLEALADTLRATGYPATVSQTRADLYLRLLDGTLDGQAHDQILATMLRLGPLSPADPSPEPTEPAAAYREEPAHSAPDPTPEQHEQARELERVAQPQQPQPGHCEQPPLPASGRSPGRPVRYGIEVRIGLATLLRLDEHPAEIPGWGPVPATIARDLVDAQHGAEWRIAIVDADGYLIHGDLTRRRPRRDTRGESGGRGGRGGRGDCRGGIVEIAVPTAMVDRLPTLADAHPDWARLLHGITGMWEHRHAARAALDAHPHRRFAHAALRRHIQLRDRSCVGPGCRRRAAAAELDHTRDHAHGGPTITTNSGPGCPRHHTMKHRGGWTLHQPAPGHFVWTSPLGQTYHTRGEPITPELPDPHPREPDPDPPGLALTFEGPILHQPEPPPPPPARPPPTELPDEPPF